jgi:hypothetical protein
MKPAATAIGMNSGPNIKDSVQMHPNSTDNRLLLETGDGTNGLTASTSAGAVSAGVWHHVFASVNRLGGIATLYVDGVNLTTSSNIITDLGNNAIFNLGRFTNSSWYYKGVMEEARIEPARSADWVWATWMNVVSNSVLASYGPVTPTAVLQQNTFSSGLELTVPGYSRGSTLTNFPLLITLSTNIPGFSYSQFASPGGNDLRFTDPTGQILYPDEIDTWNTNGTSSVWVLMPAIASTNSCLLAFWGCPALTNVPAGSTNGSAWPGYWAVFHLRENGFPYADSAGLHPATSGGAPTATASGMIGNGQIFNGTSQYLAPAGPISLGNAFSLSAWVKLDPAAANIQTIWDNKLTGGNGNGVGLFVNTYNTTDGKLLLETGDGTSGLLASTSPNAVPAGGWHQVFAAVDRGAGTAQLYVDGANLTMTNSVATDLCNYAAFDLGQFTNSAWHFKGTLDEARIEPARSADWVWATWMNVVSNAAFVHSSPVAAPGAVVAQAQPRLAATVGANGLVLSWTGPGGQYTLYSATNLAPPGQWTPVTNYTVLPGGQIQAPISATPGAVFYRLQAL